MNKTRFYGLLIFAGVSFFMLSAATEYSPSRNGNLNNTFQSNADTVAQEAFLAPAYADTIKNPIGSSPEIITKGKDLYSSYCFACHGETGYGDGVVGASMDIKPADFHEPSFTQQKDGIIFWKLTNGKGNMPPFKDMLKDEQRWQLVAYLKDLGKN
jgi:mono/diheme cytochrome c family protein